MEGNPFGRADKPLMLALLALEATTHALLYEGPSTIYVSDSKLAGKLDNRQVKWGSVKDPATRVLRKVHRMAASRIKYKHQEAVDRMAPDPDEDTIHLGVWLAGQVAAGRPMSELSDIVYVNDHVVPVSLPDILLRARDGETWTWTDTVAGALSLLTSQEAIDQVRIEMALTRREAARHERSNPPRWDFTTTRYSAVPSCLQSTGPGQLD